MEANRRGEITSAQNSRLNGMTLGRQGCSTLIAPGFVLGVITFILFTSLLGSGGIGWFSLLPVAIMLIVLVGFSKGINRWWRNITRLKTDRANGMIRSGVGQLGYSPKNGFSARANEEELVLSAAHDSSGLLPGVRYNFYYLPESRFVLSAEQLGEISSGQVRQALTEILAVAQDGPTLVFVEVKTRTSADYGIPAETVTRRKQRRIVTMAKWYLSEGLRIEMAYGYGELDRFGLKGWTHFFQGRFVSVL